MGKRAWPVLVGAVAVAAVLALLFRDDDGADEPSPPATTTTTDPTVADDFLAAYERSRTATFVVEQVSSRPGLTFEQRLVQRPPGDRVVVGGGSAEGRVGGRVVRCLDGPGREPECFDGGDAGPYDEEVEAELDVLRTLLAESYGVRTGDPGCFVLELEPLAVPSPTYGDRATLCFDHATGAPTRFVVEAAGITRAVEAEQIRPEVTDADLDLTDLGSAGG